MLFRLTVVALILPAAVARAEQVVPGLPVASPAHANAAQLQLSAHALPVGTEEGLHAKYAPLGGLELYASSWLRGQSEAGQGAQISESALGGRYLLRLSRLSVGAELRGAGRSGAWGGSAQALFGFTGQGPMPVRVEAALGVGGAKGSGLSFDGAQPMISGAATFAGSVQMIAPVGPALAFVGFSMLRSSYEAGGPQQPAPAECGGPPPPPSEVPPQPSQRVGFFASRATAGVAYNDMGPMGVYAAVVLPVSGYDIFFPKPLDRSIELYAGLSFSFGYRAPKVVVPGYLEGTVTGGDGKPIVGAVVRAAGRRAESDSMGRVSVDLPAGRQVVEVKHLGFSPLSLTVEVPAGASASFEAKLAVAPGEYNGTVISTSGKAVGGARLEISGPEGRSQVGADGIGHFDVKLPAGTYRVAVFADGFLAREQMATLRPDEVERVRFELSPAPQASKVARRGASLAVDGAIEFHPNTTQLTATSMELLDQVADLMVRTPSAQLGIAAHVDKGAPDPAALSQDQADTVKAYLALRIAGDRLSAAGRGASEPVIPSLLSRNAAMNRRVVFTVQDKPAAEGR